VVAVVVFNTISLPLFFASLIVVQTNPLIKGKEEEEDRGGEGGGLAADIQISKNRQFSNSIPTNPTLLRSAFLSSFYSSLSSPPYHVLAIAHPILERVVIVVIASPPPSSLPPHLIPPLSSFTPSFPSYYYYHYYYHYAFYYYQ